MTWRVNLFCRIKISICFFVPLAGLTRIVVPCPVHFRVMRVRALPTSMSCHASPTHLTHLWPLKNKVLCPTHFRVMIMLAQLESCLVVPWSAHLTCLCTLKKKVLCRRLEHTTSHELRKRLASMHTGISETLGYERGCSPK